MAELLAAGGPVTRVLLAEERAATPAVAGLADTAARAGIAVEVVARDHLDALTDGLVHQGVVALAPAFVPAALEDVLASVADRSESALLVALDGVTDPHNLGSIARSAEAVGAHGLIVPARRSAGITPVVEKAAAGALAHLPLVQVPNLVRALAQLRAAGVWSLGLAADGEELADHPLVAEPCVLVVGAEGAGLARLTRERCDALVRLPMRGRVASLNVSVAAAVALYTVLDRRR